MKKVLNLFVDLKFGFKVGGGFVVILVLIVFVGGVGYVVIFNLFVWFEVVDWVVVVGLKV